MAPDSLPLEAEAPKKRGRPALKLIRGAGEPHELRFAGNVGGAGMQWQQGGRERRGAIGLILECPHDEALLMHASGLVGQAVTVTIGAGPSLVTFEGKFRRAGTTTREVVQVITMAGGDAEEKAKKVELVLSMKVTTPYTAALNNAIGYHVGQGLEDMAVVPNQEDLFAGGARDDGGEAVEGAEGGEGGEGGEGREPEEAQS